jgi:primosomal protein N''
MATKTIQFLNLERMPNESLKLSTVAKNTVEVNSGFQTHLNKVTNAYNELASTLSSIQKTIDSDTNSNKKYFDNSTIASFKRLSNAASAEVRDLNNRRDDMKKWANKDTAELRRAAKRKTWIAALDILINDKSLSSTTREALKSLKNII